LTARRQREIRLYPFASKRAMLVLCESGRTRKDGSPSRR